MAILLHMPEVAANMESATIVSWAKAEGDPVAVGDALADIETDKAVIEFTAEAAGVLGRILVPAGQAAAVAAPIGVLLAPGEQAADIDALLSQAAGAGPADPATAQAAASAAVPAGAPASAAVPDEASAPAGIASAAAAPASAPAASAPAGPAGGRLFASPLARRLAAEAGLDLRGLPGSGPHGRIVKRDVRAALARPPAAAPAAAASVPAQPAAAPAVAPQAAAPAPAVPAAEAGATRIPHSAMRRTIARRLLESKTSVPHFYLRADCRMDELLALRETINAGAPRRISVNDMIVKAAAVALAELPDMNVSWTDEALLRHAAVDISVAVATENGLITPIVRQAEGRSLSAISADIARLAQRAREGRLQPQEYQGGSFTVSNLGMHGVREFAAIINPPQAAILAVGATERRAVVDAQGQLAAASMMSVTLSVDHRAIDGALAARWLKIFRRLIEAPLGILI
ncbi:Dihydrolipoamide acetyltransferase component of pyruvate dehydrogenase complex [Castellaniella defragrans 65Phen]|uniref:Acetyltransferase component of pyruvate dehydrogenase complex n=4 Tax=Castellaniella defragrans TaxID=75697 RepID=W8X2W7_CASD6|nr:pyruvate dehydrogenase complex dihydrolipoamide acetyltransferase [Castellaniella defragrans]MBB6082915.1 pyruvate dehydrogenase E2 component (dihydrolipoamide acetyltransferase) [Castellaniella defragrans]CDM23817.1 Dihydrolipoamide acetyltransferase component of pyruvate dehydrogenase complex [Castellaniella defragrans 65Phen]